MSENTFELRLLALIPHGAENAVSARDLSFMLGCRYRMITSTVFFLRTVKDIPICSNQRGYYLPDRKQIDDLRHYIRTMNSRRRKIKAATESAERLLKLWESVDDEQL